MHDLEPRGDPRRTSYPAGIGHDVRRGTEPYAAFSVGEILGADLHVGPVRDIGLVLGANWAADAELTKYLPGVRLALAAPGFTFLNLDVTAYLDDSGGIGGGGAPAETDSYMIDLSWALPFAIGDHRFSVEGHVEYIGARHNELGERLEGWLLAQPQLRWDVGRALMGQPDTLFVGAEWQLWLNKLGDPGTDENALQALLVWRL